MEDKKIRPDRGMGCLTLLGILIILLTLISTAWTIIRISLSAIIGVRPIDDETGEYVSIPWLGTLVIIGIAILLRIIEQVYYFIIDKYK